MTTYPGVNAAPRPQAEAPQSVTVIDGEIDYDTAHLFGERLRSAAERPGPILLDMSAVSFMDTAGVQEIRRVCQLGREVVVRAPSPSVRSIFGLTQFEQMLRVEPDDAPPSDEQDQPQAS